MSIITPKEMQQKYMHEAILIAEQGATGGTGGPFGAVIVKNEEIVASAANMVTGHNDPTAHAEINAIRQACSILGTFDLSGCELYASCEPCPMCLAAICWARIDRLYYAASRNDAAAAGFDDCRIYAELSLPAGERRLESLVLMQEEGKKPFSAWEQFQNKIRY